jgi:sulfite reductase (NADPH) flavoprotein alpha-component
MIKLLHRWMGLTLGLLLVLAGLSGSLLVFKEDIDAGLNPQLFHNRAECAAPLDLDGAVAALRRHWPQAKVSFVTMPAHAGGNYGMSFKAQGVADSEAMLDSCSGELLGSRDRDAIAFDRLHLMPLLQRWHASLLQGKPGRAALGYVGLAWLALLLAGLALAWPARRSGAGGWKRALRVRLDQNTYRSNYDLHRAAGLLAAVVMLVSAFTGFYNGLPELTRSLVGQVADVGAEHRGIALAPLAKGEAAISWNEARAIAEQHLSDGASVVAMSRTPDRGLYQARLRRADDWQRTGTLRLFIDMRNGALIDTINPISGKSGDRFLAGLFPLHSGQLGATAGRWIVALSGLLPSLFFITGLTTWWLRRKTKRG